MPRADPGTDRVTFARPVGVAAGGLGLLLAWFGGAAIARLTGATAVVIVLAAGVVWFVAGSLAGLMAVHRVRVDAVTLPPIVTQAVPFSIAAAVVAVEPMWVEIRSAGSVVASGWSGAAGFSGTGVMTRRGAVRNVHVRVRSAGRLGLVWWGKRFVVAVPEHLVAPALLDGVASVRRASTRAGGELAGRPGAVSGAIDGLRPWREGDSERFVHWTSTLRTGELVVHDRREDAEQRWVVRAQPGTADPDAEAGRARSAIEQGLRRGADVYAAVGDAEPVRVHDRAGAARWTALADVGAIRTPSAWSRRRRLQVEPESTAPRAARWWSAAATVVGLTMLTSALQYGPIATVLVVTATLVGAAVTAPALESGAVPSGPARTVVAVGALLAFASVAVSAGRLDGVLALLRGPLPQILMILIALHGFECRDRRTVRVGLAISGVVLMYAAGLRVDDTIIWWLLAWMVCFGIATTRLSRPATPAPVAELTLAPTLSTWQRSTRLAGAVTLSGAATIGLLSIVPIPSGPANLTLPTFIDDAGQDVARPGGIVDPAGSPPASGTGEAPDRAPAGRAGGYAGFADSMDTSVRGALSDEVVMRVRAPEPDFWRGQTFASFDGRRWYADDAVGVERRGPNIEVERVLGDTTGDRVEVDRFVQTYIAVQDLPNVVFTAYRPVQVVIDADVWTREDGAIRASTTLPAGSVYTVVSERPRVTADLLRSQGHTGRRLNALGQGWLARYLEVPPSTTPDTIELANSLAAGSASTYDVVLAYEAWMGENIRYDLDAPLPDEDEDAVHDFLFDSRLGFCEQIASALAIMLRTQGVPARLATGYATGSRDEIAGVYEVRASDAHAWVEVWFAETGWQAFDPTANVPLSGETAAASIGGDLLAGVGRWVRANASLVAVTAAAVASAIVALRIALVAVHRRRRGRWGMLQDRFVSLATQRGAGPGASNPRRADRWTAADDVAMARLVAERLDRVAFDPTFSDDDRTYRETRKLVGSLRERRR